MPWCHNNFNSLQEKITFPSPINLPSLPTFVYLFIFSFPTVMWTSLALELIAGIFLKSCFSVPWCCGPTSLPLSLPPRLFSCLGGLASGSTQIKISSLEQLSRYCAWELPSLVDSKQATPSGDTTSRKPEPSEVVFHFITNNDNNQTLSVHISQRKAFPIKARSVLRLPFSCFYFQLVFFSACKFVTQTSWTAFILY